MSPFHQIRLNGRGRPRRIPTAARDHFTRAGTKVVTHVTDLGGINRALDRLRRGAGARTIVVIDAALAGLAPGGAQRAAA